MFLSSGVLSEAERSAAFASVAELPRLSRNWNRARNLVSGAMLETIDMFAAGFSREGLAAHADGSLLLLRAAGQLADSKAAAIYCERGEPESWLPLPDGHIHEREQDQLLRTSLAQVPLESAAMFLDAALNHLANAVVRFAWEAGFAESELAEVDFRPSQPVTSKWTSWSRIVKGLEKLHTRSALLARFTPALALLSCSQDADLRGAIEYRHNLVHRGVPADLWTVAVQRPTAHVAGPFAITTMPIAPAEEPRIDDTRDTIGRALAPCAALQDAICEFLPRWADYVGMSLTIDGKDVTFNPRAKPSQIALPSYAIITGPNRMRVVEQRAGQTERLAREQRDPTLFVI